MSYYLRVLCKSATPVLRSGIIAFVREGVYFEAEPEFAFSAQDGGENAPEWDILKIYYDPQKRPITLTNTGENILLREELRELREATSEIEPGSEARVLQHLDATRRIIAIEIDPESLSESAWAMLDCLQSFLASRLDGMIFAPDEGYYDAALQLVARIRKRYN